MSQVIAHTCMICASTNPLFDDPNILIVYASLCKRPLPIFCLMSPKHPWVLTRNTSTVLHHVRTCMWPLIPSHPGSYPAQTPPKPRPRTPSITRLTGGAEDIGHTRGEDDIPHEQTKHGREGGALGMQGARPALRVAVVVRSVPLHSRQSLGVRRRAASI